MTKIKLNGRQKAIGTILIFPWYLYFAPIIFKFLITLYTSYINNNVSVENINVYYNVLSFIGEMIVNLFLPANLQEASNQTLVVSLVSYNAGLMAFNAVILAPIVEELLFRGLIFNSLRQRSMLWAHLISAFLFGFLHVYSYILSGDMSEWIKLIPYMMAGFGFSFAYERRQNIVVSIFLHSIKNLIAMILIYIML